MTIERERERKGEIERGEKFFRPLALALRASTSTSTPGDRLGLTPEITLSLLSNLNTRYTRHV